MEKLKVGFEILHYISTKETIECIDSIKKYCNGQSFHIVIVDNASPNNSYDILKNQYEKDNQVTLLKSEKNLGFAQGNNLGYMWLKTHYDCDFIVMSNNDVELLDETFVSKLEDYYAHYKFAVLGPNIQNFEPSSGKCNPMRITPPTVNDIQQSRRKLLLMYCLTYIGVYYFVHELKRKIVGLKKYDMNSYCYNYDIVNQNVQLHGCFLVFSRDFISKCDGLNPKTFLYFEEEILFLEILRSRMLSISVPDIRILHKERAATKARSKNRRDKDLFVLKNKIKSSNVLLAVAKEYWRGA